MSLAKRLRALMRWRGIQSQNQLARISGVPQSCIHRILTRTDGYSPSRRTLLRLANALQTSVPWLSDGVISATQPHDVPPEDAAAQPSQAATQAAAPHAKSQPDPASPSTNPHAALRTVPAADFDGYCAEICLLLRPHPDSTKKTVLSLVRLLADNRAPRLDSSGV